MITIFAIANTENKNYEYLCDLKERVKQTLPVGSNVKIYLPCAVHSHYYLLKDMKRMRECDFIIPLDDDHTDIYTDILEYFYHNMRGE